ncbi:MAG: hypothetical protein E7238_08285 [Sarcina sp.]|nr:hypothetical protein [Sarcina sp.]
MVVLLLKQILSMMIMVACGFVLVKTGILKAKDSGVLSSITIYLVLPCVIISSFQIEITASMCDAPSTKVETIRNRLKMSSNSFSTYRKRLTKKGIIQSPDYGWLSFTLPRFREFILRQEI